MAAAEQGGQGDACKGAHPSPAGMPDRAHPARPRFSESQAAKLCGVSRSTIQRARKRGDIPGVERVGNGWSLPLEGLLAAGFKPESGAGTPLGSPLPAGMPERTFTPVYPARSQDTEETTPPATDMTEIHRLELELEQARAEARVMRAERDAAQAVADERQRIIALLEAPRRDAPAVTPVGTNPASEQPKPPDRAVENSTTSKRARWTRIAERWLP